MRAYVIGVGIQESKQSSLDFVQIFLCSAYLERNCPILLNPLSRLVTDSSGWSICIHLFTDG
ncbi:hypothetical protein PROFUN_12447 [Planoprotostelium fungivorum]|uniref:Uncharacterized protein n=1 Tax=Planoprotostelium fungivorum TaxID=1890364 RepID=A0A2P6N5S5_9EUKA|nr:hypothetical protein PROFUN_12447 [Planoprotostelium fungivorum]